MTRIHAFGDDALGELDAVGLVEALNTGDVSASELVDAAIARAEAVNPSLNGLAYQAFDRARRRARSSRPYGGYFDGTVETYLHKRAADLPPAVGVLVEYTGSDKSAAHAVALQIAALKAKYLTRDDVPADVVANERRIAEETARNEGKPEEALPKIVEGRVTGFYKDVVLLDQPSVSDNKKTVKALLDEAGVTVTRFVRFEVGQA